MAFFFNKHKIIYIIVPGTGSNSFHGEYRRVHSNSLEKIKKPNPLPSDDIWELSNIHHEAHITARHLKTFIDPEIWKSYRKIGFIRNPFDWVNSIYNKGGIKNAIGIDNAGNLSEMVETLDKTPYDWFVDDNGELLIDTIYRLEDLETEIFKEFGCCVPENRKNVSSKPKQQFSENDKYIIKEKFYREFKHYANIS